MIEFPSKNKACHLQDETGIPKCVMTLDSLDLISPQILSHSAPQAFPFSCCRELVTVPWMD